MKQGEQSAVLYRRVLIQFAGIKTKKLTTIHENFYCSYRKKVHQLELGIFIVSTICTEKPVTFYSFLNNAVIQ